MAVFGDALASWIDDSTEGLDVHLDRAFKQLRGLS
jgi:hypothetical protein